MRRQIVDDSIRVDGRKLDEVRPVSCRVDLLPKRVHGSGLFNRGLTQVLSACTLGTPGDAQNLFDDLQLDLEKKRYLHHYNFPPYSVGKPSLYALLVAAKSVTVRWQKELSFPSCHLKKTSHT